MGAIQNAANQLAQTGLGAAVAAKHLKQQELNNKITGANAISSTQNEFNEVNTQAENLAAKRKEVFNSYNQNMKDWAAQVDYKASGKHPNGLYSLKQLEAKKTAAISDAASLAAIQDNYDRVVARRAMLLDKKALLKEAFGKEVVDIRGIEDMRWQKAREAYQNSIKNKVPLTPEELARAASEPQPANKDRKNKSLGGK